MPLIQDVFYLPATLEELLKKADGRSILNPFVKREGIVVRHRTQQPMLSFKVISNEYLLKEK